MRVKFVAKLENARIAIQVDVGFGDAVMPRLLQYPTVLPMPAPQIQAYPMETVIDGSHRQPGHVEHQNEGLLRYLVPCPDFQV